MKGEQYMLANKPERFRDEKINGEIFDMSPVPNFRHSVITNNINCAIKAGLKDSLCLVFMENIDYKYSKETDDYLEPDIIICCDRNKIRGNSYYGTPKFVAETLSPFTVKRDRGIKKDIYEASGVEEYWIVSPVERAVEIYYLKNGKYEIEESYILDDDETSDHYNLKQEITLRAFPITMTLEDIFSY